LRLARASIHHVPDVTGPQGHLCFFSPVSRPVPRQLRGSVSSPRDRSDPWACRPSPALDLDLAPGSPRLITSPAASPSLLVFVAGTKPLYTSRAEESILFLIFLVATFNKAVNQKPRFLRSGVSRSSLFARDLLSSSGRLDLLRRRGLDPSPLLSRVRFFGSGRAARPDRLR